LEALTNPELHLGSHYHHLRPPAARRAASSSSSMMMMKMMAPEGNREGHSKLKFDPYVGAGGVFYFTPPGTNPLIKQRQSSRDDDVKLGYTFQPLEGTVRGREQSQWNDTVRSSEKKHIESSSWRNEDVNDESRRQGIMAPNWHNENAKIETHPKHMERGTCHEMHNGLYPSRQQQHNSTILAENWSDQDHNSERDYAGHGRDQCLEEAEGPRIFRHGNHDDQRSTKHDYKGDSEQKVGRTKERVAGSDEGDLFPSKPASLSTQSEHYYTSQQRKKDHALANRETLEENSPTRRIPEARKLCYEGCCKRAMRIERSQHEDEQVLKNWDKYASKFIYPGGVTDNQDLHEPEYMMHRETGEVVRREERDDGYKNQEEDLVSEEESLLCNHRHGPIWQQWKVGRFKGAAELHIPTNCQLQRKQTSDPNQQQKERLHHVSSTKTNLSKILRHQTYHHHLRAAGEIGQGQVEEDVGFGICGEENLSKATSTSKVLGEQWESGTVLGSPDIETGSAACCAMSLKHSQSKHKQKLLPLRHELKNSVDHRNSDNHHEFSCNNPVNTVDNSDIDTCMKAVVDCNEQGMRRSNLGRSSIFPIVLPRFQQQQGFGPNCITFGTPIINNLEFEADNRPDCSCHNIGPPESSENKQQKGDKLPNVKPASNCPPTAAIRSVKYAPHMEVLGRHRYLYDMSLLELVNKLELEEE
jgi:hypothetical protein